MVENKSESLVQRPSDLTLTTFDKVKKGDVVYFGNSPVSYQVVALSTKWGWITVTMLASTGVTYRDETYSKDSPIRIAKSKV